MRYEREPEWFPLIARSLRDGAAHPPVYRWDLIENLKHHMRGD